MILKITPDKERARSVKEMALERYELLRTIDMSKFSTMAAETYYEAIKELLIAKFYEKGIKIVGKNSHKDLLKLSRKEKLITEEEFELIDDLRQRRNKSSYQGVKIPFSYIEINQKEFERIIEKIK